MITMHFASLGRMRFKRRAVLCRDRGAPAFNNKTAIFFYGGEPEKVMRYLFEDAQVATVIAL